MNNYKRQIVLDTETTGINTYGLPHKNHRIIEIGALEIINRRFTKNNFHVYIQPDRLIDSNAFKIHGINNTFLLDKPFFKDIAESFLKYINKSELIIHNASFDLGFIEQEFSLLNNDKKFILKNFSIIDTLKIARNLFPGKKNTLDALCTRYKISTSQRKRHSAIIDAQLLGKVYLLMTGGQESLSFFNQEKDKNITKILKKNIRNQKDSLKILQATEKEINFHKDYLKYMKNKNICLWD